MQVKVKVQFSLEEDSNINVVDLVAKVRYSIPSMNGFRKNRTMDFNVETFSNIVGFLEFSEVEDIKTFVKKAVRKEVRLDIMKNLNKHVKLTEKEQVSQVLNMINQMKFDFEYDLKEAKDNIKEEISPKELNPCKFGKVHGDYFNLHSKE